MKDGREDGRDGGRGEAEKREEGDEDRGGGTAELQNRTRLGITIVILSWVLQGPVLEHTVKPEVRRYFARIAS